MTAIVFDLDHTLLHFTREYEDVLATAIAECECDDDVSEETLETYFEVFFERFQACESNPVRGAFETLTLTHSLESDPAELTAALHDAECRYTRPPENVAADLERLGDSGGYAIGVLTNGVREWQLRKLREAALEEYVDVVVASYNVGAHKPNPDPFRLLEERLPADEYAMIGDSDSDIDGARAVGWGTYRYDGQGFGALPDAIEWSSLE